MIFRKIAFGSDDFRKECELRNEVLRLPLGLSLFDEELSHEQQQMHFGMFDPHGKLVACVIAVQCTSTEAKIRQMAVDSGYRGKGYGRRIIYDVENDLAQRGFIHLYMNARIAAVGFYEKLGYAKVGDAFIEIGIPHVKMEKTIHPAALA